MPRTTDVSIGIQDNAGSRWHSFPYLDEGSRLQRSINHEPFVCEFEKFERLSIGLRIGGKFGDFGGSYGHERRRLAPKSKYLGCDMVVQARDMHLNPSYFDKAKAQLDFLQCIDFLLEHKSALDFPGSILIAKKKIRELMDISGAETDM